MSGASLRHRGRCGKEIERFYSNYVSTTIEHGRASVLVRSVPDETQLAQLAAIVPLFARGEGFAVVDSHVTFNFEQRNYANLRLIIDALNDLGELGD